MSRNTTIFLWLCLLSWLPITSFGQTLTQYEYWFDDNFGDRTSGSLSGYTALFDQEVDASSLSNGIHKFSFRVKQSDGHYSAVTSSLFLKVITGGGTTMEYWFDDKIDQRVSQDIASDDAIQEFDLDLHDDKIFPTGFHKLNIRVNIDNQASAIYSTGVYKFPVGNDTRLDYWLDSDTTDIKTLTAKAANDGTAYYLVHDDCDLSGASIGFHKLNMRVIIDGIPSAVYTSSVFKQPMGSGARFDYWLDNDTTDIKTLTPKIANDGSSTYLIHDDCDLSGTSIGFHKLNMRVTIDGQSSAVYTSNVFKLPMGSGARFDYWLDNDTTDIKTLTPKIANDGSSTYLIHDDCDLSGTSIGFHKLNMRVTIDGQPSAVYSTGVYKMPEGNLSKLEYWFDNDKTVRTIPGTMSNDGSTYQFFNDLEIDDLTPGHHRLYCRAVSDDGLISSAVTSTAVIVKSKYDVDPADVKVIDQAYWFDDGELTVSSVDNPKNVINQPNTFDTRQLADGQHTLHVQFGNSAGVWNGPVDYIFEKTPVVDPSIEANATVEDGIVTLNYTAIPFALSYEVVRKYPSGHKRLVNFNESSEYPAPFRAIDTPGIGTYTYYIEGNYIDLNGVKQEVRSDEMTVTVERAASTVEQAKIYCEVRHDGVPIYPWGNHYKVFINGTDARETEYVFYQNGANFSIGGVPYGTELTISVRERDYGHKDITLIASKNTNDITYKFDGIYGEVEEQLANDAYDVILTNSIHLTPDAWELSIRNKMRFHTWSGDIIVKMIRKATLDLYNEEANGGVPIWKFLRYKELGVDDGPNYKTVAKMHVHLEKDEHRTIALDLIDLPASDLKEDYYVCIFTKQDGSEQMKELGGGYVNPQTVNFNPCDYLTQNDLDLYLVNEYKQVMSYLKQMSQWGDPFAFEINSIPGDNLNEIINNLGNGRYFDVEGFERDIVVNGSHSAGLLLSCFLGDVVKDVKRYAKNTRGSLKIADGIQEVFNTLRDFYQINEVDENLKFFETFKQVIKVGEKLKINEKMWGFKYPAFEIYKTYFDVAEAMVKAIDKLEISVQEAALYEKLISGKGIYKIKVRRYTTDDRVEYFPASDVYDQIREIKFQMTTEHQSGYHPESTKYQIDSPKLSDEITISNVDFDHLHNNISTGIQLWMIITWRNNRVTRVPMLEKHFAKLENFKSDTEPPTMTVELQSETYLRKDYMANKLTIINQK